MRPGPPISPTGCSPSSRADREDELSHELITTASLMYTRRLRPGIRFDSAQAVIAEYAADPARLEDLSGRITAFRLACCFERLKRSGRLEDVLIEDPFDPEGAVSVKLTGAEWRSVSLASTPRDASPGPHDFSRNYSPQLNVIERFWKLLRRRATHNRLFETMADLRRSLRASLCYYQTVRVRVRSLVAGCCAPPVKQTVPTGS